MALTIFVRAISICGSQLFLSVGVSVIPVSVTIVNLAIAVMVMMRRTNPHYNLRISRFRCRSKRKQHTQSQDPASQMTFHFSFLQESVLLKIKFDQILLHPLSQTHSLLLTLHQRNISLRQPLLPVAVAVLLPYRQQVKCHPERSNLRILQVTKSKDLHLLLLFSFPTVNKRSVILSEVTCAFCRLRSRRTCIYCPEPLTFREHTPSPKNIICKKEELERAHPTVRNTQSAPAPSAPASSSESPPCDSSRPA
jgi:hypothetical protein